MTIWKVLGVIAWVMVAVVLLTVGVIFMLTGEPRLIIVGGLCFVAGIIALIMD